MSEDTVYTPIEISDTPFPSETESVSTASSQSTSGETYSTEKTKNTNFPDPRVAVALIGQEINTRSKKILSAFEFTPSGAIQIGNYQLGISGDIRISPEGIIARNKLGDNTVVIDGDTGDLFLMGILQAGTVIGGKVVVGNNTFVIDGDAEVPRMLIYEDNIPWFLLGEGD